MQPGTHFTFGDHEEHGFVASFTASMPAHLAHWYLEREQFEPVPGEPGLYRLSEPERDGVRRTRQAVHDLRRHGYTVQATCALTRPSRPARHTPPGPTDSRSAAAVSPRPPPAGRRSALHRPPPPRLRPGRSRRSPRTLRPSI
ncbi:hypothetical protein GCM10017779_58740 [Streptomyces capillispiralis]|nr:hypothetical protein GCM10017779_58740 [Streptomyces capillispiralis]